MFADILFVILQIIYVLSFVRLNNRLKNKEK